MSTMDIASIPLSVYIHWPWCIQKCPYCDFNSHVQREAEQQAYVEALLLDWQQQFDAVQGRAVHSVFFGGGTPSLADPDVIARLIERIQQTAGFSEQIEITLEANPGTADASNFAGYHAAGVNRLSLGVQSFDAELLRKIGRIHDGDQAKAAIELAKKVGFENINFDLMVGLPGQSLASAMQDVQTALSFQPQHISHYQLTLEPNTPFFARPPKDMPDEDLADSLLAQSQHCLAEADFERYEVSAWSATADLRGQHNVNYWQFGDYIGLGAGAHGKVSFADGRIERRVQAKSPTRYTQDVLANKLVQSQLIATDDLPFEFMLNVLRLRQGVGLEVWQQRTLLEVAVLEAQWKRLSEQGLVEPLSEGRIVTTPLGYRYLNRVISSWLS